jgi:hypothetical protein
MPGKAFLALSLFFCSFANELSLSPRAEHACGGRVRLFISRASQTHKDGFKIQPLNSKHIIVYHMLELKCIASRSFDLSTNIVSREISPSSIM